MLVGDYIIVPPTAKLIEAPDNPLEIIENAARTCYKSADRKGDKEKTRKFVRSLITRGHTAMLEFVDVSLRVKTDRATANQLVRHRMGSYAQESMRYCRYDGKPLHVIWPGEAVRNEHTRYFWHGSVQTAVEAYTGLIEAGWKPEQARAVLPLCTATEIVVKKNMRAMREFLTLRLGEGSSMDMRCVASLILLELVSKSEDYELLLEGIRKP